MRCGRSSRSAVALSGLTAVSGQPLGVVREDPELRAQFEAAMFEVWSLARARGVALADDFVAEQLRFADTLPCAMRSSLLDDLAAGNRLEAPGSAGPWAGWRRKRGSPRRSTTRSRLRCNPYRDGRAVARPKETA